MKCTIKRIKREKDLDSLLLLIMSYVHASYDKSVFFLVIDVNIQISLSTLLFERRSSIGNVNPKPLNSSKVHVLLII